MAFEKNLTEPCRRCIPALEDDEDEDHDHNHESESKKVESTKKKVEKK